MKKITEKTMANAAVAYVVVMLACVCAWSKMPECTGKTLTAFGMGVMMIGMTAAMVAWGGRK